uniref:BTB domain-containing protein n=1 Tax=Strongyloides papillosus TaxID=174720 RepID=A0A0N5B4K6_STREA
MNLQDSEDSNVDCNTKNNIKRASLICIIENFPSFGRFRGSCGKYFGFSVNNRCSSDNLCDDCRQVKLIAENGHTSNIEMDFKVKCSLSISISPNSPNAMNRDYVSLLLQFKEFSHLKVIALCKFSILNKNGNEEYKSVVGVEKFDASKNSYYLQKFININDLLQKQKTLLADNKLTVFFEMFYLLSDAEYVYAVLERTRIGGPLNMFLNDMSRMVDSSEYYDCIIKVGDHEINVHKCILDARSEVFRSTLKRKRVEPESNIIEVNDFRLGVVKDMVNFLYTGKSPRIDEIATEMLEIAEKYKLEGLKIVATESLLNSLNVENVCEYLEKSEICSAEILKEFCLRYIYLNADKIIKSEKWSRIVNLYPLLLDRIFKLAVCKN